MGFANKQSGIDFTDFIGQKATEISRVGLELVNIKFDGGSINVECSWRLRKQSDIIVGITEREETEFISLLEGHLINKHITKMIHFETGDLVIEFEGNYYFDLFADSSVFEQYQLYRGDGLFLVGR